MIAMYWLLPENDKGEKGRKEKYFDEYKEKKG